MFIHLVVFGGFIAVRSHAGLSERNCSVHETSEGQGSSRSQHREEVKGYPLGRKIVSVDPESALCSFMCVGVDGSTRITSTE